MTDRAREADEYFAALVPPGTDPDVAKVVRQASAGLVWSKQYYPYGVARWLDGDAGQPAPPSARKTGRNSGWRHLDADDIFAMPDPWEYPWFAAWDLALHAVAWTHLDPAFAKYQVLTLLREWYLNPNGALPAYEWSFDDVNPPVHAFAALRVFPSTAATTSSSSSASSTSCCSTTCGGSTVRTLTATTSSAGAFSGSTT